MVLVSKLLKERTTLRLKSPNLIYSFPKQQNFRNNFYFVKTFKRFILEIISDIWKLLFLNSKKLENWAKKDLKCQSFIAVSTTFVMKQGNYKEKICFIF